MFSFVWRVTRIACVLAVLCAGSLLLGQRRPYPLHPMQAHEPGLCNGQPCVMGLTVGQTPWRDVAAVFAAPLDYDLQERQLHVPVSKATSVSFFPSIDGVHVGRGALNVRSEEETLPVGWLVVWYGEPCGLSYYPRSNNVVVRYPHTLINMRMGRSRTFTPFTPARSIHWQDAAFENTMQPDICVDNITDGVINSVWRGFTLPG